MAAIAQALQGRVGEVRLLALPGLPAKGDVSDWLNQGHTVAELQALAAAAPVFPPLPGSAPSPVGPDPPTEPVGAVYCPPTVSPCTHLANSYRIRHYYQGQIWYALGLGWILWTGRFWRPDPTGEGALATGFVGGLSRRIAQEAATLARRAAHDADEDRRKSLMAQAEALLKWAVQSEHERTIAAGLKLSKHALLTDYGALNADPWRFNVQNGTLDLRTGALRPHAPADLITFLAPVIYNPSARCPTWERFLLEVFASDRDLVAFLQRAVGWSLTGVVKERALFFLYGDTGKNGKTTLVETLMKLVGASGEASYGYGRKIGADTFMKSKNPEDNQRKAATLAGPRFVCTSEVDEEHRLNEQLIKDITGGDTLEGRRLYQEAFTFKPQFKPWMYGNHKPEIRGTDDAIWSRVRLVPFEVSFKDREDLDLADKLEAELSGILNWAIEGCLDWQRHGLQPPAKVQAATQAYREEMDVFGPFIRECCVIHPHAEVWANDLWNAYRVWCAEAGVREQSQTKLGNYLTSKGFTKEGSHRVKRIGIGLSPRTSTGDRDSCDSCDTKSEKSP
jgi:putative DNA primase/helicase